MRRDLSKRATLGALLSIGSLCAAAAAQQPNPYAVPVQYNAPPAQAPPGGVVPLSQAYPPPQCGTVGPNVLPPASPNPGYATPAAATTPLQGGPAAAPPGRAAAPPAQQQPPQQEDARGLRARFPKLFENVRNATTTPGQRLAQQAAAAQNVPTGQPMNVAPGQLVRAQSPVALPQGPVIVYMPAGWQPPQDITFAPRTVSPEVPDEFWPEHDRDPLGQVANGGGMFRWPKFARGEEPDITAPQRTEPARALLASAEAEPEDDERITATKRAWNAILGTTNGDQPQHPAARKPSKALFSGLASSPPQRKAPTTRAAAAAPSSVPATSSRVAHRQQPPAAQPAAPQQAVSRTVPVNEIPSTAAAENTSQPRSTVLADFHESSGEKSSGQLQWRAKGSPRTSTTSSDTTHNRTAAHHQPVDDMPTPAVPRAPHMEGTPEQPPIQQPTAPATSGASVPAPVERQKSLIPRAVWLGQPTGPAPTPAQSGAQGGMPAQGTQAVTMVQPTTTTVQVPTPGAGGKALFPNMFAKDSPLTVSLNTKPLEMQPARAVAPAQPVYVVLAPQASAEFVESYYAPTAPPRQSSRRKSQQHLADDPSPDEPAEAEEAPPRQSMPSRAELARQAREAVAAQQEAQRRAQQQGAQQRAMQHESRQRALEFESQQRTQAQRPQAEADSVLTKPLRALGEITKLPKFITGEERDRAAEARPPRFRERYRATVTRRADARPQMSPLGQEPPSGDELDEGEDDAAPDVAVDLPSKRRAKDKEPAARDETPRQPAAQPSSRRPGKSAASEQLDRLYRATVVKREEAEKEKARQAASEPTPAAAPTAAERTTVPGRPGEQHSEREDAGAVAPVQDTAAAAEASPQSIAKVEAAEQTVASPVEPQRDETPKAAAPASVETQSVAVARTEATPMPPEEAPQEIVAPAAATTVEPAAPIVAQSTREPRVGRRPTQSAPRDFALPAEQPAATMPATTVPATSSIRRADGSTVTVYRVGATAAAEEQAQPRTDSAAGSEQPRTIKSGRRQVVRERPTADGTARQNPLR